MTAAPLRPSFASDNTAPTHPRVLEMIAEANTGHVPAYGDDPWTARAHDLLRATFGPDMHAAFVWNGTSANVIGLSTGMRPYHAVVTSDLAHIVVDECGAPERFLGSKLILIPSVHGKLTPEAVATQLHGFGVVHHVQPRIISVTQSTEYGTVYTLAELQALAALAHEHGQLFHIDGARIANAAASLGCSLADVTTSVGADIVSVGLTKNGALGAEVILVRGKALADELPFLRKQGMHLASKMRYTAAQVIALLEGNLWRANATHANTMALRLAAGVRDLPGVTITRPVQVNAVFATLDPKRVARLQEQFYFYVWKEATSEVRWMTSFDTSPTQVDAFIEAIRASA
jgi:threonine aldolase